MACWKLWAGRLALVLHLTAVVVLFGLLMCHPCNQEWLTETPLPLSSAPAPPLGISVPTAPVNATAASFTAATTATAHPVTQATRLTQPPPTEWHRLADTANLTTLPTLAANLTVVARGRRYNRTAAPTTTSEAEDYYNYDYPEPINSSGSLLRPDTIEEEEFQLPSDSLADTDLHDHDRIDSIMYIYYGEGATGGRTGSLTVAQQAAQSPHNLQVVIVGAVVALVAQFLTLASALRRIREGDTPLALLLNTELALTLSNLLFMLGVQATSERWTCETVAITLHYAHLVAASWFFLNCFLSFRRLQLIYTPPLVLCAVAVWLAPAPFVYVSSLLNSKGYETHSYCWMSLNRSLFFTFMLPVSLLLIGSCLFVVMGLRRASKCALDTESDRKTLRLSAGLLPLFAVVWLLSILALDRSESLAYPLLYVVINAFLNWFVYIWWLPGDERIWRADPQDEDYDDDFDEELLYEDPTVSKDEQALLQEQLYLIGPRDTYDLQMEPISTISS